MGNTSVRPTDQNSNIELVINKYNNTLFRICFVILTNEHDAEEALQDTYLRYINKAPAFNDEEHEKAWLIKVATNICKDMRRFKFRYTNFNLDYQRYSITHESSDVLEKVMSLPAKYKEVILLHYIEGYKVDEVAQILNITVSATKKRLQYAREKLKLEYERSNE